MRPYFYRDRWIMYAVSIAVVTGSIILHLTGILAPVERLAVQLLRPIASGAYALRSGVGNVLVNVFTDKQKTIDELSSSVTELRSQLAKMSAIEEENVVLRRQLGVQAKYPEQKVLAHVIGERPAESFSKRLLIDAGSDQGIAVGYPVVVDGALVGYVVQTDRTIAEVKLITDPNSSIAGYVETLSNSGLVNGDLSFVRLTMSQIDRNATVTAGDQIYTSGNNGRGSGILVGTVGTTLTEDRDTYQSIEIVPAVNFRNLSVVFVLITS